jgi:hypothetical protein
MGSETCIRVPGVGQGVRIALRMLTDAFAERQSPTSVTGMLGNGLTAFG